MASPTELGIGSAFKLYVLLGLADRILAKRLAWTDELAVRDEWKSLPSGITQDDPAGTKLTVRVLAERMISISDNTATDHLLYTLGRQAVEAALTSGGHRQPALDSPFLGTRELFLLKLAQPAAEVDAYVAGTSASRRKYLDHTLAGVRPSLDGIAPWQGARRIDKLEWFASADDLCRVMGTLWQRGQRPAAAPVLEILAKNPGLAIDAKVWPYVGFKGGSEPGVIDLTYLLRRTDDRWFVVTATFNADEGGVVDESRAAGFVTGLVKLTAKEP